MNNVLESDVLLNNFSRIKTYGSSSAGDEYSTNINQGPCKSKYNEDISLFIF